MLYLYLITTIAVAWNVSSAAMVGVFVIGRRIGNAGIVDAAWSLGVGIAAIVFALLPGGDIVARGAVALFAGAWSVRLGLHIFFDRVLGKPEDGRYRVLMEGWGEHAPRQLFRFFQYQAFFIVVFSLPFLPIALSQTQPSCVRLVIAAVIWLAAVLGEGGGGQATFALA